MVEEVVTVEVDEGLSGEVAVEDSGVSLGVRTETVGVGTLEPSAPSESLPSSLVVVDRRPLMNLFKRIPRTNLHSSGNSSAISSRVSSKKPPPINLTFYVNEWHSF